MPFQSKLSLIQIEKLYLKLFKLQHDTIYNFGTLTIFCAPMSHNVSAVTEVALLSHFGNCLLGDRPTYSSTPNRPISHKYNSYHLHFPLFLSLLLIFSLQTLFPHQFYCLKQMAYTCLTNLYTPTPIVDILL